MTKEQNTFTPIFIMSSERSGTNLFRMLLDNHPQVHGPRAPQLLKSFANIFPYYFEGDKLQKKAVLKDIQDVVNHSYVEWGVAIEDLGDQIPDNASFLDFWSLVYGVKAEQKGVTHIACKENHIFHYAALLKNHMPQAKFIYLHRDVRDVAASWMKIPNGFKNVSAAAQNWNREQLECIRISKTFGLEVHRVSYEDLVADTPKAMTGVLEFVGLDVDPACFNTDTEKGASQDWNEAWKNLSKKVISDNTKKYLKQLSQEELLIIETRAGESMKLLGYERDTTGSWEASAQPTLNRLFSKWAFQTAKPKYKNKQVEVKIEKLDDFTKIFSRIKDRRRKNLD